MVIVSLPAEKLIFSHHTLSGEFQVKKFAFFAALALAIVSPSLAEGECQGETINTVTVHNNGSIYFTSSKSCPSNWCQIGSLYSADAKKSMLTVLMTAKENKTLVNIAWSNLASAQSTCPTQALFAQPVYMLAY